MPAMTNAPTRPEFLTVPELAELLRIKERKVYDLAASGQVPCSRATGKLLFPEAEIRAWIDGSRSGPAGQTRRPAVFLGSHDPLLDWALRNSRSGFATIFDSSLDGLARFVAGEGAAAGLHIHEDGDEWNLARVEAEAVDQDAVLIHWAKRRRGLVMRRELAAQVQGIGDLRGHSFAPRQPEAGSEILFRHLLARSSLVEADLDCIAPCRSEQDAVLAVARSDADAAFGLQALAAPYGLGFVPVIEESFDILADRRAWFDPPMQSLMAFARTADFRDQAEKLSGYDVSALGAVKWNR
ncbi:DNA binding domain-containing protein, excisionase family [Cribrihabitans marinus]|uniref:DNA binding domain-containing protein, excisionase family n=2 Tax=Cribrihabitans marinus TaxID=1227549 RepID=A0A1H7D169_9RHOB|nr:DNA binding domain-containing protein, excisionase family [Cribrihabitans marinus]